MPFALLALVSAWYGGLLFQNQAAAASAPAANCSVSGVVRDSVSGAPMPNVKVAAEGISPVTTVTDSQGAYTLRGLKPGPVQIAATVSDALGPTSKQLSLLAGQDLTGVVIRFPNMARISGRITGEDGKPLAGIGVYLVGREYAFGALRYPYSGGAITDAAGRYVLPHVPPARGFLLLARREPAALKPVSDAPADPELRTPILAPTYYPGATEMGAAAVLILAPGENCESLDVKMLRSPSYCISGTLGSSVDFVITEAQPVSLFGLAILEIGAGRRLTDNVIRSAGSARGTAGPDGKIRICGLHPGSYELTAESDDGFGVQTVTISDHDVNGILVVAEPAVPVSGEIVWDGAAPDLPVNQRVMIRYGPTRGNGLLTPVLVPMHGPFVFTGPVFKDEYIVAVDGLPNGVYSNGVYLKDVTYGGHSILNAFFHPGAAADPPVVRFLMARDGGRATAMVADGDGKPVCDADIALMPAGADSEAALASMTIWGQTDSHGAWTSQTLAPGKYTVIAGFLPVDRSPESVGKLWRARTRTEAQQIDVGAGAAVSVRLSPTGVD